MSAAAVAAREKNEEKKQRKQKEKQGRYPLENLKDWLKTIIGPMVDSLFVAQMGQMADGTFDALPLSEFSVTVNVCVLHVE